MPWAALARLQVPGTSRCTAFLIGPQTAATSAHCLYGPRLGRFVPAGSIHLLVGYDRGSYAQHAVAASYRIAPGYAPGLGAAAGALDLALIHLAHPVAKPDEVLAPALGAYPPGTPLLLGGYGQDRAEALLADACALQGYAGSGAAAVLVHDCEGTRGTSGAPLLLRDTARGWRFVGVQATGRANGAGGTAVPAAAVQALLDR